MFAAGRERKLSGEFVLPEATENQMCDLMRFSAPELARNERKFGNAVEIE